MISYSQLSIITYIISPTQPYIFPFILSFHFLPSPFIINYPQFLFPTMHFPQEIYAWLVSSNIISNTGEQDQKGNVTLPPNISNNFDNGFLVGEIIRKITTDSGKKVPSALVTVKQDTSKNTKLTNWNFIWLAFDSIALKMDPRIKQLILQGEQALIVEVVRQLYERDENKDANNKVSIRMKSSMRVKGHAQAVDIKKINLSKDPEESETSLQFLMLLLKTSLGMNLEEILGLFTNQNKYLAHVIVKGVNDNFDSIILFYSLLNKHANKLKSFYEQDSRDAEACLYALKPGFISKNEKVAELAIELFGKLGKIYEWFVGQDSKCATTLLLGLKRHANLREKYWMLLLDIIQAEEMEFFTKIYPTSFQNTLQQVEITTFLIQYISETPLGEKLSGVGVIASWLEVATKLPEDNIQAQIICFRFVGELMFFLPEIIEQNEESYQVFEKKWNTKTLPEFATLFNELIVILERLGEGRSNMARRIYQSISQIAKNVGVGDKRDYLVENFLPLLTKFPTIPTEYLIKHLRRVPLSNSQYLLVCQSISISESIQTHIAIGGFLKSLFLESPLLNYYLGSLLKEIVQKVSSDSQTGVPFFEKLVEDVLQLYGTLEVKYKPKPKQQQSLYFGRKGSPEKQNKQEEDELAIKQKWKQIILGFVMNLLDLFVSQESEDMKDIIKQKIMEGNATIKLNNHKIGSKALEDILKQKFGVSKEEQVEHSESFGRKISAQMEEATLKKSKAHSQSSITSKLKGPENLTKQFQLIAEKRKQEEEQRKLIELKKQILEEKKKINVKKELEITNLLRGQIGEAQLREHGFLERLVQEPNKFLQVIPLDEIEAREVEAIETIFKNYHKVLRHLFLTYTWTMYNSHSNERFEDNQQRKELLTAVELGKMLKDYRLAFLTNQTQLNGLVRDINVKLLGKREVSELDYHGFQQFIIQFCALIMTRNYAVTANPSDGQVVSFHNFRGEHLHIIIKRFFDYLKTVFISKEEKIAIFEDVNDVPMSKEQVYEVEIFTKKLEAQPSYILPKGYKKVSYNTVEFQHRISETICGIPESYIVAIEIIDYIFSLEPLNTHIIEDISRKKTVYRVKPTAFGTIRDMPKERAMSTMIQRKSPPIVEKQTLKKRSVSRGILLGIQKSPLNDRVTSQQASAVELESTVERVEIAREKEKEKIKQKKIISLAKLQQLEKYKLEISQKKAKEKQEERLAAIQKEKVKQRKRQQHNERFMEEQKQKFGERRKKDEEERQKRVKQQEDYEAQKRQMKEKFKIFHQGQIEKIKKLSEEAIEKARREKQQEEQQRERQQQLKRRLRQKIEESDKHIIQSQKQAEKNIQTLYQSEPIKRAFAKFEGNLKALYDFLIQNTYLSLTEKKHNNEIIFDTWRNFINIFELSIIVHPKDTSFIFKSGTKGKIVPKEYFIGMNFSEFQQALLRIAIKYKAVFNLVSQKIKDDIKEPEPPKVSDPKEKQVKKGKKVKEQQKAKQKIQKEQNEFQNMNELNIKELIKESSQSHDFIEQFGDTSKVTDKTLIGLIYYMKVPNTKPGQQKRFRQILAAKQPSFSHHTERLKQKLNEQFTLESPVKKPIVVKPPVHPAPSSLQLIK